MMKSEYDPYIAYTRTPLSAGYVAVWRCRICKHQFLIHEDRLLHITEHEYLCAGCALVMQQGALR